MNNDIAIKVENLTKVYHIYDKPQDRLKEVINPFKKSYHNDFYALDDINFEIKKGETTGIIGTNGAGKSTLLKIITGVLTPSAGAVQVKGKIASLLELGAGFNPAMTGIENIYFNGTVMGYSKEEMDEQIEAIIAFADIGEFIHHPVKMYSSGMFARLAFSVAINVSPDILIVDEALSVGDMSFQAKCMTAMDRIKQKGTTILFVSHDINSVKSLCEKGIYINDGKLTAIGKASDIAEMYIKDMRESLNEEHKKHLHVTPPKTESKAENIPDKIQESNEFKDSEVFNKRVASFRYGTGEAKVTFVEIVDVNDQAVIEAEFNQEVKIRIYLEAYDAREVSINYYIHDDKRNLICGGGPRLFGHELVNTAESKKYMVEYITKLPLHAGSYSIQIEITTPLIMNQTAEFLDVIDDAVVFNVSVRPNVRLWTKVYIPNQYRLTQYD